MGCSRVRLGDSTVILLKKFQVQYSIFSLKVLDGWMILVTFIDTENYVASFVDIVNTGHMLVQSDRQVVLDLHVVLEGQKNSLNTELTM